MGELGFLKTGLEKELFKKIILKEKIILTINLFEIKMILLL